ncbi:MAG TPA: SgcJ/EcaC family oxidoreductase [Vicinamibacterales bacterium]|nr:SgcJ/EcaC family oxidoreductase [Vicinamibacterales bacterium]
MAEPFRALTALTLALTLVACAPAAPPDTTAEDLAAISALRDAFRTGFNAGDAAALAALFTDDAVLMNPGQATAAGPAAIEALYGQLFAEMTAQTEIRPEATEVSGSLAYDSGTYTGTMTPKAGGDAMTEEGRYVVILKKGADGSWKIARDIGNTPTMPAMPGGGN